MLEDVYTVGTGGSELPGDSAGSPSRCSQLSDADAPVRCLCTTSGSPRKLRSRRRAAHPLGRPVVPEVLPTWARGRGERALLPHSPTNKLEKTGAVCAAQGLEYLVLQVTNDG